MPAAISTAAPSRTVRLIVGRAGTSIRAPGRMAWKAPNRRVSASASTATAPRLRAWPPMMAAPASVAKRPPSASQEAAVRATGASAARGLPTRRLPARRRPRRRSASVCITV